MIKVLFEGGGERRARKRNTHQHEAEADELTSRFDPGHGFFLVSLKCRRLSPVETAEYPSILFAAKRQSAVELY